ncbi:hypothetical protein OG481_09760 [Streptomyces longwoodensis]|uniref:hypothetical protein n=1 Tax=Streptomyces longwoodensis TaxID=68231 RepID=UPI002DD89A19|nr:hypothetical protein [Streptomyces longwoodensis]WRY88802.1 hypothetical protein OG481_09760 [Streptomyces longwoodensis]
MSDAPKRRLRRGAVAAATTAELTELGVDPTANAQAAAALRLAAELDSAPGPKDAAGVARELRQAMAVVRAVAPPRELGGKVDELTKRREKRLSPRAGKGTG